MYLYYVLKNNTNTILAEFLILFERLLQIYSYILHGYFKSFEIRVITSAGFRNVVINVLLVLSR